METSTSPHISPMRASTAASMAGSTTASLYNPPGVASDVWNLVKPTTNRKFDALTRGAWNISLDDPPPWLAALLEKLDQLEQERDSAVSDQLTLLERVEKLEAAAAGYATQAAVHHVHEKLEGALKQAVVQVSGDLAAAADHLQTQQNLFASELAQLKDQTEVFKMETVDRVQKLDEGVSQLQERMDAVESLANAANASGAAALAAVSRPVFAAAEDIAAAAVTNASSINDVKVGGYVPL